MYLRGEAAPGEVRFRLPMQLTSQAGTVPLPPTGNGATFGLSSFSLSPDGRSLAFIARQNPAEPFMLFVRLIGALAPQPLTTADSGAQPFWSADGRSIAFVAGGRLKKIAASGGPPQDLAAVSDFFGGAWTREGMIIFGSSKGIQRLPAEGGTPEAMTSPEAPETGHFWPSLLPDGRHYLYTVWSADVPGRAIYVGEVGSKERVRLLAAESNAMYAENGYLLFHRGKALYAQAFDPKALALSGEPSRVADELSFDEEDGRGHFAVSQSGVLAYFENRSGTTSAASAPEMAEWHLAWANRSGQVLDRPGPAASFRGVEVSPDTKRIAFHRHEAAGGDIWIVEPSGAETRLTWDAAQHNSSPVWSPDGRDIAFSSLRNGKTGLYRKRSDGSATEELLIESELPKAPMSWAPDGKSIVYWVRDPKTNGDLWVLSLPDKKATSLINSPFTETHAQISPDGKWIAYTSDSVGKRREIHVQPFPSGEGRWQISDNGGDWPRWRRDGKELFYHSLGPTASPTTPGTLFFVGPVYAVSINGAGSTLEHAAPKAVLNMRAMAISHSGGDYHTYDVSPDGQRFLYFQAVLSTSSPTPQAAGPDHQLGLIVAMNWSDALKQRESSR
jgi:Tol biopolymer transport system component